MMSYSNNIIDAFNDEDIITIIIQDNMNYDKQRFNIVKTNNKESFNPSNYVFNEQVQGVIQFVNVSFNADSEGTESKDFVITMMIPLDTQKEDVDSYIVDNQNDNSRIIRAIKSLNTQSFDYNDTIITFSDLSLSDNNKLSQPIDSIEYEVVKIIGRVTTTKHYLESSTKYIKVDNMLLKGAFNIQYSMRKTADGVVLGENPIQKSQVNGIQISLVADLMFYKNDTLHSKLVGEAEQVKTYSVEYYNGYTTKTYTMMLSELASLGVKGAYEQGKITFLTI